MSPSQPQDTPNRLPDPLQITYNSGSFKSIIKSHYVGVNKRTKENTGITRKAATQCLRQDPSPAPYNKPVSDHITVEQGAYYIESLLHEEPQIEDKVLDRALTRLNNQAYSLELLIYETLLETINMYIKVKFLPEKSPTVTTDQPAITTQPPTCVNTDLTKLFEVKIYTILKSVTDLYENRSTTASSKMDKKRQYRNTEFTAQVPHNADSKYVIEKTMNIVDAQLDGWAYTRKAQFAQYLLHHQPTHSSTIELAPANEWLTAYWKRYNQEESDDPKPASGFTDLIDIILKETMKVFLGSAVANY